MNSKGRVSQEARPFCVSLAFASERDGVEPLGFEPVELGEFAG